MERSMSAFCLKPSYTSSERSVAGGGVMERSEISWRHSDVIWMSSAPRDGSNCSRLRAPMIGAVTPGCAMTQETASDAG